MRFKVLPEPVDSIEELEAMRAAVPLVPDREASCCARLVDRTALAAQDDAKEWLTFLRALGLVAVDDGKYRRLREEVDPGALGEAFLQRVYPAEEVIDALAAADGPLDADAVFRRLSDELPQWGRLRHADPEAVWRERVARLCEWAVLFGLAERTDGGYTTA